MSVGTEERSQARAGVWILEDSPLEAEMARRALAGGHVVEIFGDGSAVLERIANGQLPEALVVDWQLPGLSGLEVCKFLRATYDEIALPVLMVTSYDQKGDVLEALSAGANDYLSKPYDVAELTARVASLVRMSRLYEMQQQRERQLALTADVAVAFTTQGGSLDRVVDSIVHYLDVSLVALWTAKDGELLLAAARGPDHQELPVRAALTHPLAKLRRGLVTETMPGAWPEGRLYAYPLVVGETSVGLLVLRFGPGGPEAVDALVSIADVIALGVERARGEQERMHLFESERKAREDAEVANRLKDEFLATVSHELRTPLNAISGWAHMLRDGALSPERKDRALDTIQRNAKAQTQLIDDLLDVSRIVAGKLRLDLAVTNVLEAVELAAETIRPNAQRKGVRLEAPAGPTDLTVMADAARLQQIVWNLLSNAVKFTPAGGLVKIAIERVADNVEITVTDSGAGISPAFLPHVFDRFRQADASVARTHGGLGLGLAIVRHLVELHAGSIEAFSEGEGKGSRFLLRIPYVEIQRMDHGRDAALVDYVPQLKGLRVLVVDDQAEAREMVSSLLRDQAVDVMEAESAAEAMIRLREATPDILISDVAMPGEDGLSLIRRIRALPPEAGGRVPAVALTAFTRGEDRTKALVAGFDMHVPKPLEPTELLVVLASLAARLPPRRASD